MNNFKIYFNPIIFVILDILIDKSNNNNSCYNSFYKSIFPIDLFS